jgi:hypothetical protein
LEQDKLAEVRALLPPGFRAEPSLTGKVNIYDPDGIYMGMFVRPAAAITFVNAVRKSGSRSGSQN